MRFGEGRIGIAGEKFHEPYALSLRKIGGAVGRGMAPMGP